MQLDQPFNLGVRHPRRRRIDDVPDEFNVREFDFLRADATVEAGFMTKDLALLIGPDQKWLSTIGFLDKVAENLQKALATTAG